MLRVLLVLLTAFFLASGSAKEGKQLPQDGSNPLDTISDGERYPPPLCPPDCTCPPNCP